MVQVTIDRFEGEMAVVELEEGKLINLPKIFVPDAKEGDIVEIGPAEVSRFYFASIDNDMMTVLTPKGKYSVSPELSGGAKPGEPILFKVNSSETKKHKNMITGLVNSLFE